MTTRWEDGLTPREADVYRLVQQGYSNKRIAAALGLSPSTISTHLERVFLKSGLHNRRGLMLSAARENNESEGKALEVGHLPIGTDRSRNDRPEV